MLPNTELVVYLNDANQNLSFQQLQALLRTNRQQKKQGQTMQMSQQVT